MRKRILQATLIAVFSLFVISVIAFAIGELAPGNPTTHLSMQGGDASKQIADMQRRTSGLEAPVHIRYWRWLTSLGSAPAHTYSGGMYRARESRSPASGASPNGASEAPAASARPLTSPLPAAPAVPSRSGSPPLPPMAAPRRANHMVVKNAEFTMAVEDVATGVDRVTQVAQDTLGYIVSSRTWFEGRSQRATLTIAVPVDEFEGAVRRVRAMAIHVVDETASGTDVTDQYVDLESRLRNLEATEARIRSFLEQAADVDESLRINKELAQVTAQIEETKGKMSYLRDRAAYSTITVHLEPPSPTPTPAPTGTPTPTPGPDTWRPDETFDRASGVLGSILRVVGDLLIWVVVVPGPFAIPAVLLTWLLRRLRRRAQRRG